MILEIYGKLLVKINKYILKISDKSAIIRLTRKIKERRQEFEPRIKQYDVVMVNLPEVESGSNKQAGSRPAVIIQNDVGNKFFPQRYW